MTRKKNLIWLPSWRYLAHVWTVEVSPDRNRGVNALLHAVLPSLILRFIFFNGRGQIRNILVDTKMQVEKGTRCLYQSNKVELKTKTFDINTGQQRRQWGRVSSFKEISTDESTKRYTSVSGTCSCTGSAFKLLRGCECELIKLPVACVLVVY